MADTSKTFAQLIIDLADNATGAITEEVIRNLLTSIFQYGELAMPASASPTAGQTIGATYTKVNQFTIDMDSSTFITPDAANNQITVVKGGEFAVFIGLSFSGTNNSTWTGSLHVDDVDKDEANFERKLSSAGDVGKVGSLGIVSLADAEVVSYYVKADASGKTFVLHNGSLIIIRIG